MIINGDLLWIITVICVECRVCVQPCLWMGAHRHVQKWKRNGQWMCVERIFHKLHLRSETRPRSAESLYVPSSFYPIPCYISGVRRMQMQTIREPYRTCLCLWEVSLALGSLWSLGRGQPLTEFQVIIIAWRANMRKVFEHRNGTN